MEEICASLDEDKLYDRIIDTNIKNRTIILNESINTGILEDAILWILNFNKMDNENKIPPESRKKIYIYLNSNGGDVVMGLSLINTIKSSTTPVVVIGFGVCASMACYILAAGHERLCLQDTVILHHDGTSGYYTSSNKGKDIQQFYDKLDVRIKNFMIENTNMTQEFLDSIADREYYMFPEEAKELGIIDKIIGIDVPLDYIF